MRLKRTFRSPTSPNPTPFALRLSKGHPSLIRCQRKAVLRQARHERKRNMAESPVWHPFTQHGLGDPIPLISHAKDARLYDAQGNSWIDAISSWWVTTHGPIGRASCRERGCQYG